MLCALYVLGGGLSHAESITFLSHVIGWMYFLAWSVSFYPQLILNYQRKSTQGLSYNFVWLNLLGYTCYSIFNCALFFSVAIRREYRNAHGNEENLVRANDVFFALHAFALTSATLYQMYFCGYSCSPGVLVWKSTRIFLTMSVVSIFAYAFATQWFDSVSLLSWLYFVSYIKLVVSFLKYIPQLLLNHQRKSTDGWSLHNVVLDFTGGFLSFVQLYIDSLGGAGWDGILGDPVKFGLSILTLVFDALFLVQHYILFPESEERGRKHTDDTQDEELRVLTTNS